MKLDTALNPEEMTDPTDATAAEISEVIDAHTPDRKEVIPFQMAVNTP